MMNGLPNTVVLSAVAALKRKGALTKGSMIETLDLDPSRYGAHVTISNIITQADKLLRPEGMGVKIVLGCNYLLENRKEGTSGVPIT